MRGEAAIPFWRDVCASACIRKHGDDVELIEVDLRRGLYEGYQSDAAPSTQREVSDYMGSLGLPGPNEIPLEEARVRLDKNVLAMLMGSKRLDGSWTRERLGVTLRYPDYRAGLGAIWERESPEIKALITDRS